VTVADGRSFDDDYLVIATGYRNQADLGPGFAGNAPTITPLEPGIVLADKMLPPRRHGLLIPGPQTHLTKLAFEKYILWKMRYG
jgi:sulfide:quinone oxidoreductase